MKCGARTEGGDIGPTSVDPVDARAGGRRRRR
eukprot:CAMPEP_0177367118 /NCGR_PEP_ID=MMETSP0368-20130122/40209_1 /TAXON_ID=447022 ORGANISM="Scrippsiella hangoei-like, Strain SHHI-4" /NCGR_SAMPLE_ID=MMETSP0368 /ASSEMBLY_ACC=CAM_ASM_000363 /LENGTH=31 /DNA_ID= /DNA_START= /DNA_END= /DNA_ORIENTATION=